MNVAQPMTADERIEQGMLRPASTAQITAIYFLSDGENVIYVGQSRNVKRRIARHSVTTPFVYAWYEPCDSNDLNRLESEAIQKHAGPYLLNQNANGLA